MTPEELTKTLGFRIQDEDFYLRKGRERDMEPTRDEEMSDLEEHGQFEHFTPCR